MLVHTYFTDGFYGYAKILIKSFKYFHGEENVIIATTRNLTDSNMLELDNIYKNLIILNKKIDMTSLSKRSGYSIEQLLKFKESVEYYKITAGHSNVIWKQYISVEDRYRNSILEAYNYDHGEKYIMHIDADSYIKKSLDPLFEVIQNNDVSLILRLDRGRDIKKIYGTLSGYTIGKNSRRFLEKWRFHIDKIHLKDKPQGYGQSSCYYAWRDLKNSGIKFGVINKNWVHAYDLHDGLLIRTGNHGRGKTKTLEIFENEWREMNG